MQPSKICDDRWMIKLPNIIEIKHKTDTRNRLHKLRKFCSHWAWRGCHQEHKCRTFQYPHSVSKQLRRPPTCVTSPHTIFRLDAPSMKRTSNDIRILRVQEFCTPSGFAKQQTRGWPLKVPPGEVRLSWDGNNGCSESGVSRTQSPVLERGTITHCVVRNLESEPRFTGILCGNEEEEASYIPMVLLSAMRLTLIWSPNSIMPICRQSFPRCIVSYALAIHLSTFVRCVDGPMHAHLYQCETLSPHGLWMAPLPMSTFNDSYDSSLIIIVMNRGTATGGLPRQSSASTRDSVRSRSWLGVVPAEKRQKTAGPSLSPAVGRGTGEIMLLDPGNITAIPSVLSSAERGDCTNRNKGLLSSFVYPTWVLVIVGVFVLVHVQI